jgi:hypothetical protein
VINLFEAWSLAYRVGWAKEADLNAAVIAEQITEEEKILIMG